MVPAGNEMLLQFYGERMMKCMKLRAFFHVVANLISTAQRCFKTKRSGRAIPARRNEETPSHHQDFSPAA